MLLMNYVLSGEDMVHTRGLGAWRSPHQGGGQGRDHGRRGGRGWGATQEEAQSRAHQAINKYSMLLLCYGRYTDKVISPNPIWMLFFFQDIFSISQKVVFCKN